MINFGAGTVAQKFKLSLRSGFEAARSKNPTLHFAIFFRVAIIYAAYRVISRPIFSYGALDASYMTYPRPYTHFHPTLIYEIFSGAWIHRLWWPSVEFLSWLQLAILVFCLVAFLGVFPRLASFGVFIGLNYQTSLMQSTNSEVDGGTLLLFLLLWFSVQQKSAISPLWRNGASSDVSTTVALTGSQAIVGAFYFYSGLNKLVDVGLLFPWKLSLPNLAEERQIEILFDGSIYGVEWVLVIMSVEAFSVFGGLATLIAELALLPALLFWRKLRAPVIITIILLHTLVLLAAGINFTGNSILLLASMDMTRFTGLRRVKTSGVHL